MDSKIDILWSELSVVSKKTWSNSQFELDPSEFRFDDLGAIIKRSEQGTKSEFGWNVDHIFPRSKGGDDNIKNLQLLHWKNNEAKGDDFPGYCVGVTRVADGKQLKNMDYNLKICFADKVINELTVIYPQVKLYPKPVGEWYSLPDLRPV